jgi:hypothetical protein
MARQDQPIVQYPPHGHTVTESPEIWFLSIIS